MNIEKYTQKAQEALASCQEIAVSEGHQQIDGEHLHLALMKNQHVYVYPAAAAFD